MLKGEGRRRKKGEELPVSKDSDLQAATTPHYISFKIVWFVFTLKTIDNALIHNSITQMFYYSSNNSKFEYIVHFFCINPYLVN